MMTRISKINWKSGRLIYGVFFYNFWWVLCLQSLIVTLFIADDIRKMGARNLVDILITVSRFIVNSDTQGAVSLSSRGIRGTKEKFYCSSMVRR